MNNESLETQLAVNAIRVLAIDAVEKANSGHPGTAMGLAPVACALWTNVLRYAPKNPDWANRDRFVLSCGHASILLYSLLHLSGYDLSINDIKNFRQLGSKTPGHPERGCTPGIEVTTGPLGQGFGNSVGMAIAESILAQKYNRPGFNIVDHRTWVVVSDGDIMEGISSEAASLAGHLNLGKLFCIYDDNSITIDGETKLAFSEDVAARFKSYGWNVISGINGDNYNDALKALNKAVSFKHSAPTLIILKTTIGFASPNKSGKASAHGAPLGAKEAHLAKECLGWKYREFDIPKEAYIPYIRHIKYCEQIRSKWLKLLEEYKAKYPSLAENYMDDLQGNLKPDWDKNLDTLIKSDIVDTPKPTRSISGLVIENIAKSNPMLIGGSADLGTSNNTLIANAGSFLANNRSGRNIHYGVREHAMGAITNGIAAHGGFIPYAGTFLVFSDYMRAAIRISALSSLKVIWVLTHDSILLGEDGPTHQPISHIMSLRMIPDLTVIRPADGRETVEAWQIAMKRKGPTAILLTRQEVKPLSKLSNTVQSYKNGTSKGAYVVVDTKEPKAIIVATGSEVAVAVECANILINSGIKVRVVSMPSWELFEEQSKEYKDSVMLPNVQARVTVEAGTTLGWERYAKDKGEIIGIKSFGLSAPHQQLTKKFGFTPEKLVQAVKTSLCKVGRN